MLVLFVELYSYFRKCHGAKYAFASCSYLPITAPALPPSPCGSSRDSHHAQTAREHIQTVSAIRLSLTSTHPHPLALTAVLRLMTSSFDSSSGKALLKGPHRTEARRLHQWAMRCIAHGATRAVTCVLMTMDEADREVPQHEPNLYQCTSCSCHLMT